jgi:hypothetical protein
MEPFMTNLAQQIRELSNRLVAINERGDPNDPANFEKFPALKIGDIDPRNGQKILSAATDGSGNVIRSRFGDIYNVKYGPADAPRPPEPPRPEPVVTPEPPRPEPVVAPEPSPPDNIAPMPIADPDPVKPTEPCGPELKAKLRNMPSFNKAYATAKQGGCGDFEWCQIITVPDNIAPMPSKPADKKVDYLGQADPLGGTMANPMSFAANSNFGAESIDASTDMLENEELNRWRKIAGLKEADSSPVSGGGDLPEIKAGSKSAAIAQARKKGIKRFRWCSTYKVTDAKKKPNIAPMPKLDKSPEKKVDYLGQADPLGGTMSNPMSFAANSNFGA